MSGRIHVSEYQPISMFGIELIEESLFGVRTVTCDECGECMVNPTEQHLAEHALACANPEQVPDWELPDDMPEAWDPPHVCRFCDEGFDDEVAFRTHLDWEYQL